MSGQANIHLIDTTGEEDYVRDARRRYQIRADFVAELERREKARRERWIDAGLELAIVVFTLAALWLVTSATPYARWGHVVGLFSQPFYIAATWRARRWGMFFVAVVLVGIWLRGIANNF